MDRLAKLTTVGLLAVMPLSACTANPDLSPVPTTTQSSEPASYRLKTVMASPLPSRPAVLNRGEIVFGTLMADRYGCLALRTSQGEYPLIIKRPVGNVDGQGFTADETRFTLGDTLAKSLFEKGVFADFSDEFAKDCPYPSEKVVLIVVGLEGTFVAQ